MPKARKESIKGMLLRFFLTRYDESISFISYVSNVLETNLKLHIMLLKTQWLHQRNAGTSHIHLFRCSVE